MPAQITLDATSTTVLGPPAFLLHAPHEILAEVRVNLERGRSTVIFTHRRATAAFFAAHLASKIDSALIVELHASQSPEARADALSQPGAKVIVATGAVAVGFRVEGAAVLHAELPPYDDQFVAHMRQREARSTDPTPTL